MRNFHAPVLTFTSVIRAGLLSVLLGFADFGFSALAQTNELKILVLGDSISAGFGIDKAKGWVNLLEKELLASATCQKRVCQVINASVSGSTTEDGANRIGALFKRHQPSLLILELGGNDGLRGYSLNAMKRNLLAMINTAHQHQASVFLLGMQIPPNYGKKYTEKFRQVFVDVAQHSNVDFLPFLLNSIATDKTLMQDDGIHPNEAAQPLMMQTVWELIQPKLNATDR